MPNALMDEAALEIYVLRKFGAPLLKVELMQEHLDDAVNDAKRWFSAKKGLQGMLSMTAGRGQTLVPLPDDCDTVLECIFRDTSTSDLDKLVDPMALIDGIPKVFYSSTYTMGFLSTYQQTMQYLKSARKVLGTDPEWFQQDRNIVLTPATHQVTSLLITFKKDDFQINKLNERDYDLVKRRILAESKETLGRIRSKYSEFPSAQGQVQLDGNDLLKEAQQEKEKLDEEIMYSAGPIGMFFG